MKIYLDEPVTIKGIRIGHTKEGLQFMIAQQTRLLKISPEKFSDKDRQHAERCIEQYKQHLELYNNYQDNNSQNQIQK